MRTTSCRQPVTADRCWRVDRRWWFDLHSWVGLKLSLLLAFVLVTGTLATLGHEIDWLLDARMRVSPLAIEPLPWSSQIAAVQNAFPDHQLQYYAAPLDPWFASTGLLRDGDGGLSYAQVDPYTGQVQGETPFGNAHRFLRFAHRHLMLPIAIGVPIVCSAALLLTLSLVSSGFIYKRWWRGFTKWPRRGHARRWWGDLHRLLGLWSIWFIILIAATGMYYLAEQLGAAAPPPKKLAQTRPANASPGAQPRLSAEHWQRTVDAALLAYPGLQIQRIQLPSTDDDPVLIEGHAQALLVRPRANAVAVRWQDGWVLGLRKGDEMNVHQRLGEAVDPLHFGTWGGLPTRLLWFVFGALLSALSLSGAYLYTLRVTASLRDVGGPVARRALHRWWVGMSYWRWAALALILICGVLTPSQLRWI